VIPEPTAGTVPLQKNVIQSCRAVAPQSETGDHGDWERRIVHQSSGQVDCPPLLTLRSNTTGIHLRCRQALPRTSSVRGTMQTVFIPGAECR
jgi:hypothetical protein